MSRRTRDGWLVSWPVEGARAQVLCVPEAGGSAGQFRSIQDHLGPATEVLAVQLPGRERRLLEAPVTEMAPAVEAIADAVADALALPYLAFGHSMGAIIAYEVVAELIARGLPAPQALVVSGCLPPDRFHDGWLQVPGGQAGVRERALARVAAGAGELDAESQELMCRPILGDYRLSGSYAAPDRPPLAVPIVCCAGEDDRSADAAAMAGWAAFGTGARTVVFSGGHRFHQEQPERLAAVLDEALSISALGGRAT